MTWFYKKKMKKRALDVLFFIDLPLPLNTILLHKYRKEIMKKETSQMEPPPKGK